MLVPSGDIANTNVSKIAQSQTVETSHPDGANAKPFGYFNFRSKAKKNPPESKSWGNNRAQRSNGKLFV